MEAETASSIEGVSAQVVAANVRGALEEDVGSGDITAALIPASTLASAKIITREDAVLCGGAWVEEVFQQLDPDIELSWRAREGEFVRAGQTVLKLRGRARHLLTGERVALNFLQLLSGTASICRRYADRVRGTQVRLLDTRKTVPGLRQAQKYAVRCGGCFNHRIGLFDAFLIKENHIAACGGIEAAVNVARQHAPGKLIEVEVETMAELQRALAAAVDVIMLDNFTLERISEAVSLTAGRAKLEVSGGIAEAQLSAIADTGVDLISIGALTKDCRAIDLSMLFDHE